MSELKYPVWICHPCGVKHGNKPVGVATWHENTCDICGDTTEVTEPRDFGHLKDTWEDAALQSLTTNAEVDHGCKPLISPPCSILKEGGGK